MGVGASNEKEERPRISQYLSVRVCTHSPPQSISSIPMFHGQTKQPYAPVGGALEPAGRAAAVDRPPLPLHRHAQYQCCAITWVFNTLVNMVDGSITNLLACHIQQLLSWPLLPINYIQPTCVMLGGKATAGMALCTAMWSIQASAQWMNACGCIFGSWLEEPLL